MINEDIEIFALADYMSIDISDAIINKIDYNKERGRIYETD